MDRLYTSSGVITNRDQPRVGVTSKASPEFLEECMCHGIDLGHLDARAEFYDENPDADEEDWLKASEHMEFNGPWLYGDWKFTKDGGVTIDHDGEHGFAVQISVDNGDIVTVCWSRLLKWTHHTSPCYVMADGSGPCGDLDTPGDSVLAYTLPADCLDQEGL